MRTFNTEKLFNIVFDASVKALENLDIKYESDRKNKSISASKGFSIWSWGEEIQITFEEQKSSQMLVKIESISSAQLIGWGKNNANEEEIENAIKEQLKKK